MFDCIEPGAPVAPAVLRVVLCQTCADNGDWDTMWPGSGHDQDRTWGVAMLERDDAGESRITWEQTGLTMAEAEALV